MRKPTLLSVAIVVLVVAIELTQPLAAPVPPGTISSGGWAAGGNAAADTDAAAALRALLAAQAAAWNRGDIEGFMAGYWNSSRTTFAGAGGILRGWQDLLDRYRRDYPDRAAMGRLTFSELEITPLGSDAAVILGHWQLERTSDRPGGVFTLVARRLPEGWRIVHDHTSGVVPRAQH